MILVDFNQVCISNFMTQVGNHTNMKIEDDMIRHMVLNTIRAIRTKFKEDYGEVVICTDSKSYWRRDFYPYYKANRKKDRAKSDVDWTSLFSILDTLREELKTSFPYKVVNVDGAEADDVIATLTKHYHSEERVLIVSSDKDFMQLQKYRGVSQYSMIQSKYLRTTDPHALLKEHVLRGDRGDGIPNFLSDDDVFVTDKRQKSLRTKLVDRLLNVKDVKSDESMTEQLERNYDRNRTLIDLDCIPKHIEAEILDEYKTFKPAKRMGLLNYFIKNKLRNLTDSIGEF